MAALHDLEVKTADIQNAYCTRAAVEKVFTILGLEWGEYAGTKAIIVRSIYGTYSAASSFRNHLADCMHNSGYKPCRADPDLWYKPKVTESDGFEYYAYMLLYVDNILSIDDNAAEDELLKIDKYFKFERAQSQSFTPFLFSCLLVALPMD